MGGNASGAECKAVCTEAGMFALRERGVHVTQEDFEMAVSKVMKKEGESNMSLQRLWKRGVWNRSSNTRSHRVSSCNNYLSIFLREAPSLRYQKDSTYVLLLRLKSETPL